jgi:hypothetical protein
MAVLRGPEHVFEFVSAAYRQLVGHREVVGKPMLEALPEVAGQSFLELLDRVFATDRPFVGRAMPVDLQRTQDGTDERRFVDLVYQPITEADGADTLHASAAVVVQPRAERSLHDGDEVRLPQE